MSATRLAARYAKSILDLAVERQVLDEVLSDMRSVQKAIRENREFYMMLKSPIVNGDKKMEIVLLIFKGKLGVLTEEFFRILMRKNREAYLPEIIHAFLDQYNAYKHITPVTITTAAETSTEVLRGIIAALQKETGIGEVELHSKVDPALIGGYILEWEDKLIDKSIARNLYVLKDAFANNDYIRKF